MEKPAKLEEKPDMPPDDIKQLKAHIISLERELGDIKAAHIHLKEAYAALQVSHGEYVSKHGPLPKPYQPKEGDSLCPPVGLHEKCPECQWDRDTQTKPGMVGRQPHPVK